jgi:hypothetical protein
MITISAVDAIFFTQKLFWVHHFLGRIRVESRTTINDASGGVGCGDPWPPITV